MTTTDMTFKLIPDENASGSFNSKAADLIEGLVHALSNRGHPLFPMDDGTVTLVNVTDDFTIVRIQDTGLGEVALLDAIQSQGGDTQLGLNNLQQHVIRL